MSQQPSASLDIANLALDLLRQEPISSLIDPAEPAAYICARWYDQVRRQLLRKYIFNFARKTVYLTVVAGAPVHPEYSNAYALPADFVRLLKLGDRILWGGSIPTQFFDFSGGYLYCDDWTDQAASLGSPGLEFGYIFDAQNVLQFDAAFVDLLALQLAARIARKVTGKGLSNDLLEELRNAELAAAAVSGQEKPPVRVQRSRIRDVRRSGGIFRNNTVIGGWGP